ncbi:hypothetical protein AYO49_05535 [Verrucomicrobiaceae bacterium SCGC AG-212-N21]|nr:hypothetical protein AYO49_05535 [Verrucomicrobiaceae bacterium SCGC AG-212-N21]
MSSLSVSGASLHQLQTFLSDNAGKDIRAKQDGEGNVTLYARSSWKPSMRFLSHLGDMSGRTAKQDLARTSIKNILQKQGLSEAGAEKLLGSLAPGELKATSFGGKGIWIGGKGFNFPGMGRHTGLSRVVTDDAVKSAIKEEVANFKKEGAAYKADLLGMVALLKQYPPSSPIMQALDKNISGLKENYNFINRLDGIGNLPQASKDAALRELFNDCVKPAEYVGAGVGTGNDFEINLTGDSTGRALLDRAIRTHDAGGDLQPVMDAIKDYLVLRTKDEAGPSSPVQRFVDSLPS